MADASRYTTVATNEHVGRNADVFDVAQAFGLNGPLTLALKYLIRFQRESDPEDAQRARHCLERAEELEGDRKYHTCDGCGHHRTHHDARRNTFVCGVAKCDCEAFVQRF